MKNRMIAIVLAITMVLPICLTMGLSVGATGSISDFAGGSGTEDDPYLISTAEHLNNVRKQRDAYFEMINDVEFEDEGKRTINKKKVEEHFKAEITIDLLKDFVIELATNVCKDYENKIQFSKEKIK